MSSVCYNVDQGQGNHVPVIGFLNKGFFHWIGLRPMVEATFVPSPEDGQGAECGAKLEVVRLPLQLLLRSQIQQVLWRAVCIYTPAPVQF